MSATILPRRLETVTDLVSSAVVDLAYASNLEIYLRKLFLELDKNGEIFLERICGVGYRVVQREASPISGMLSDISVNKLLHVILKGNAKYLDAGESLLEEVLDCAGVAEIEGELGLLYEVSRGALFGWRRSPEV